jgi:hypothetical protein
MYEFRRWNISQVNYGVYGAGLIKKVSM